MRPLRFAFIMLGLLGWLWMSANAQPAELAALPELELGTTLSGQLGRDDPQHLNNGARYDLYRLPVTRGDVVDLRARGESLLVLSLFSPRNEFVDRGRYDDAGNVVLARELQQSGDYLVVVSAESALAFGAYRLRAQQLDTVDGGNVVPPTTLTGVLSSNDERRAGRYRDRYEIILTETQQLVATLTSDSLDTYLELYQDGELVAENDDSEAGTDARLALTLAPGRYELVATSFTSGALGVYELQLETLPRDDLREIAVGTDLIAALTLNEFRLAAPNGDVVNEALGNGQDGTDENGTRESSTAENEAADPDMADPDTTDPDTTNPDTTDPDTIDPDTTGPDTTDPDTTGLTNADTTDAPVSTRYVLVIGEADEIVITLRSSDFDSYLYLYDGEQLLAEDDDSGSGTDARIERLLAPGRYQVVVSSFGGQGVGLYALNVARAERLPVVDGGTIAPPATVAGTLTRQDRLLEGNYADYYTFSLDDAATLRIDAISAAFDSYLYLYEGTPDDAALLARNDDGPLGTDAQLRAELAPGRYTVAVSSLFPDVTGDYTLRVVRDNIVRDDIVASAGSEDADDGVEEAERVLLSVRSVPTGATVLLGGETLGVTPLVDLAVTRGAQQRLEIERVGYQPFDTAVDLLFNRSFTVRLTPLDP